MPGQPLQSPAGPPVPPETGSPFIAEPPPRRAAGASPNGCPTQPAPATRAAAPIQPQPLPPGAAPGGAAAPAAPGAQPESASRAVGMRTAGLVVRLQDGGSSDGVTATLHDRVHSEINGPRQFPGRSRSGSTPISVSAAVDPAAKTQDSASSVRGKLRQDSPGRARTLTDRSVSPASVQEDALPVEPPAGATSDMRTQVLELMKPLAAQLPSGAVSPVQTRPATPSQDKPAAASPSNILDREIVNEPQPVTPAQVGEAGRMNQGEAAELANVLVPPVYLQNDTEAYGYPERQPGLQDQYAAGVGAGNHECAVLPV